MDLALCISLLGVHDLNTDGPCYIMNESFTQGKRLATDPFYISYLFQEHDALGQNFLSPPRQSTESQREWLIGKCACVEELG